VGWALSQIRVASVKRERGLTVDELLRHLCARSFRDLLAGDVGGDLQPNHGRIPLPLFYTSHLIPDGLHGSSCAYGRRQ